MQASNNEICYLGVVSDQQGNLVYASLMQGHEWSERFKVEVIGDIDSTMKNYSSGGALMGVWLQAGLLR